MPSRYYMDTSVGSTEVDELVACAVHRWYRQLLMCSTARTLF